MLVGSLISYSCIVGIATRALVSKVARVGMNRADMLHDQSMLQYQGLG